jgi:hypothetical protein
MGSTPPNCKFSGLLRYKHSKGSKGLQFFMYAQRAIQTLGSFAVTLILETTPSSQRGRGKMMWDLWVEGSN